MKSEAPFVGRKRHIELSKRQLNALYEIEGVGLAGSMGQLAIQWALEPELTAPLTIRKGIWPRRYFRDLDVVAPNGLDEPAIIAIKKLSESPAPIDNRFQAGIIRTDLDFGAFFVQGHPLEYAFSFLPNEARTLYTREIEGYKIRTLSAGVHGLLMDFSGSDSSVRAAQVASYNAFLERISNNPSLSHELASPAAIQAVNR